MLTDFVRVNLLIERGSPNTASALTTDAGRAMKFVNEKNNYAGEALTMNEAVTVE